MCIMCLTPSTWQVQLDTQDDAVLSSAYLVHGSAGKVNRSGADAQVITVILSLTCNWHKAYKLIEGINWDSLLVDNMGKLDEVFYGNFE